jgi:ATP-dependent DNA helicase RecG
MVCQGEMTRPELQKKLHLNSVSNFRNLYLAPALEGRYIEMTLPDKPQSHSQKYRLTAKGKAALASLR